MKLEDLNAYEILNDRYIEDVDSRGILLRHKKTGARVAVLSNSDDNKVFYIAFRTTPEDSTGCPHIIEHTTLCGSDKYPVKDPFIELAKGSLNTFLNAITFPDKTMYPIASYNNADFNNLMDVYLDAVFHPNITKYEEIFKQEGWHYELDDPAGELKLNGVVYNEMKGAYSSPDEVLNHQIHCSLFPDNTYGQDSGGDPERIPELTYQAYLDFYHQYYHPSNSYIYLYGDMDAAERLDYMDREYLSQFDDSKVDSAIIPQKPFEKMAEKEVSYAISAEDTSENQTWLSYNMVVGSALDIRLNLAIDTLNYALISAPGAPVKKALLDAGIGEDIYGMYNSEILQPVFSIIAQNTELSEKDRFVSIIREVLQQQIEQGINKDALLASINSSEFRFREADFGPFPKGLLWGISCMDTWLFDDAMPFRSLECLEDYEWLKQQIGTGYYEQIVKDYLLDNTFGSIVSAVGDPEKLKTDEQKLKQKLQAYKESLSDEEIAKIIADTKHLHDYQTEPSSPEALRTIPMLSREDLRKEALPFSNKTATVSDVPVLLHDIPTNGIDYFTLLFSADDFTERELSALGLLAAVLGKVNTEAHTYSELANTINIYTGGIRHGVEIFTPEDGRIMTRYMLRCKVLSGNLNKALELIREIILTSEINDRKRLKEIILQTKVRLQSILSQSGDSTAATRATAGFSEKARREDLIRGISYYRYVCRAEKMLKEDPEGLISELTAIAAKTFCRKRVMLDFTGRDSLYHYAEEGFAKLLKELPEGSAADETAEMNLQLKKEAYTDASQIQYVAQCGNFRKAGYTYKGTLRLLRMILSLDYLWNQVRVKGGAYGAGANFLRNGDSCFTSYRDPNLRKTLEAYEGIACYVEEFDADDREMTKYIIGTFGSIDTPMNPEAKGRRSLRAWLEGTTYETIQQERDDIRNASAADIRSLAGLIRSILDQKVICVIGNENMIHEEAELFGEIHRLQTETEN